MNIAFSKCSHKINMLGLLVFFCLSLYANRLFAENKKDNPVETKISHEEINKLRDEVKEIRRDQLNYKIEKDLLKETYSTNYQAVNTIITLILAGFTILSFVGFKGIRDQKKEYEIELEKLREVKKDFESKLIQLTSAQLETKEKLVGITSINDEQSKKIKILELKETARSFFSKKNYQRAFDYIAIGLDSAIDDIELLSLKALCLTKLARFPDAIEINKKILSIEPNDKKAINNLAELFLFEEKFDSYEELIKDKMEYFASDSDSTMIYLESVKYYMASDETNLISTIDRFLQKQNFISIKLSGWDFSDLYIALRNRPNNRAKNLLMRFTQYLQDNFPGTELKKMLGNSAYLATS